MSQMYNPDEIITKANAMTEQGAQLKSLIEQMSSIVSDMSTVWQSPAQQSFSAKYAEIEPQLSSFVTSINSFAERAVTQANAVKQSEDGPA